MYIFLTVWQTDTASVLMEAIGYINFLRDSISSVKVDSHHSGSQQDMMSS